MHLGIAHPNHEVVDWISVGQIDRAAVRAVAATATGHHQCHRAVNFRRTLQLERSRAAVFGRRIQRRSRTGIVRYRLGKPLHACIELREFGCVEQLKSGVMTFAGREPLGEQSGSRLALKFSRVDIVPHQRIQDGDLIRVEMGQSDLCRVGGIQGGGKAAIISPAGGCEDGENSQRSKEEESSGFHRWGRMWDGLR